MIATILSAVVFAVIVTLGVIRLMWAMAAPQSPYPTEISEDEYR